MSKRLTVLGKSFASGYCLLVLAMIFTWSFNIYKLTQCDFTAPYKDEIVHAIGVFIPPASLITVWF